MSYENSTEDKEAGECICGDSFIVNSTGQCVCPIGTTLDGNGKCKPCGVLNC